MPSLFGATKKQANSPFFFFRAVLGTDNSMLVRASRFTIAAKGIPKLDPRG